MATDPLAIVLRFFEAWGEGSEALEAALRGFFRPDTEWVNVGLSRSVGVEEALALGAAFEARLNYSRIVVETLHAAANGNVVFTERIDRLVGADGSDKGVFAIAGVFELDDSGRLIRWRDYTDPSAMAALHA